MHKRDIILCMKTLEDLNWQEIDGEVIVPMTEPVIPPNYRYVNDGDLRHEHPQFDVPKQDIPGVQRPEGHDPYEPLTDASREIGRRLVATARH